jgi:hypothetical protein
MNKKFYKTIFQIEVLSEDEFPGWMSLEQIAYEITSGCCSGVLKHIETKNCLAKNALKN